MLRVRPVSQKETKANDDSIIQFPGEGQIWVRMIIRSIIVFGKKWLSDIYHGFDQTTIIRFISWFWSNNDNQMYHCFGQEMIITYIYYCFDQTMIITYKSLFWCPKVDEAKGNLKPFTFNVVFEPEATQADVLEHSGMKRYLLSITSLEKYVKRDQILWNAKAK